MQILLDTQVFLWFLADSRRLSSRSRKLIDTAEHVFVSSASIWECGIKVGLGRIEIDPAALVAGIDASGFVSLSIAPRHALALAGLPAIHKDPFDRMLVAQSLSEPLVLLTNDGVLADYGDTVQVV
jgi:PIN domain nuclease of toxin-antitoxin system